MKLLLTSELSVLFELNSEYFIKFNIFLSIDDLVIIQHSHILSVVRQTTTCTCRHHTDTTHSL